jgi:hypothetical protein
MRTAHHRTEYRTGPHHSWLRRKTYHLTKLIRLVRVCERLSANMRWLSPRVYEHDSLLLSQWRDAIRDAAPYANDTEGTVWE